MIHFTPQQTALRLDTSEPERLFVEGPPLTVLSFSAGQDSTALLYMLLHLPWFRQMYAPNDLYVIMADTGDEYRRTLAQMRVARALCRKHDVPFDFVSADRGYHTEAWATLDTQYDRNHTCASKAGSRRSCTANLKIGPLYSRLDDLLCERYGFPFAERRGRGKLAIKAFGQQYGQIQVLIGIAAREDGRITFKPTGNLWFDQNIRRRYPLHELGMDRESCQQMIAALGYTVPPPSHCRKCHFQTELEVLWLSRTEPEEFSRWVRHEQNKLAKFADRSGANHTVFGDGRTLPEVIAGAAEDYRDWSDEQISSHLMSHGHAVCSNW